MVNKLSSSQRQASGVELREIKALIALMRENGLTEIEIEDKRGKIRLVRESDTAANGPVRTAAQMPKRAAADQAPRPAAKPEKSEDVAAGLEPNQVMLTSPMVGTFYRAASPGAEPFVHEGDTVRKGQPLCIIEAMKMMNELESQIAGRVVRILVENGQPIEYGQPLMVIEAA